MFCFLVDVCVCVCVCAGVSVCACVSDRYILNNEHCASCRGVRKHQYQEGRNECQTPAPPVNNTCGLFASRVVTADRKSTCTGGNESGRAKGDDTIPSGRYALNPRLDALSLTRNTLQGVDNIESIGNIEIILSKRWCVHVCVCVCVYVYVCVCVRVCVCVYVRARQNI
jgi:hypothetical protein